MLKTRAGNLKIALSGRLVGGVVRKAWGKWRGLHAVLQSAVAESEEGRDGRLLTCPPSPRKIILGNVVRTAVGVDNEGFFGTQHARLPRGVAECGC